MESGGSGGKEGKVKWYGKARGDDGEWRGMVRQD
jgi:hypothetical protein